MVRNCIKNIIEPLGFINEGDGKQERWVAIFSSVSTRDLITVVLKESCDEWGNSMILFNVCDESGELISTETLDQLLMRIERDLMPIPEKSNKKYASTFNVTVQVPMDMNEMSQEEYLEFMKITTEEIDIGCHFGIQKLREVFEESSIHVLSYEWESTIEISK